jgi:hypothetical protein
MSDNMIERVARALYAMEYSGDSTTAEFWERMARAAIEAMREPTQAMLDAGEPQVLTETVWRSMIDAVLHNEE